MRPNGWREFCGLCSRCSLPAWIRVNHGGCPVVWNPMLLVPDFLLAWQQHSSLSPAFVAVILREQDLLLKPFLVAVILTTMSSLLLCCRPSLKRMVSGSFETILSLIHSCCWWPLTSGAAGSVAGTFQNIGPEMGGCHSVYCKRYTTNGTNLSDQKGLVWNPYSC